MKKTPVLIKLIFSSRDINYMSGNEKYWGGGKTSKQSRGRKNGKGCYCGKRLLGSRFEEEWLHVTVCVTVMLSAKFLLKM